MSRKADASPMAELFFENPTREFNLRETARILKISPTTAGSHLESLVKKGFAKERKERNLKLYKANLENDLYLDSKKSYSIRKLRESGLIEALNDFYLKPAIVLFGSFSTGLDTETSDIDLVV